MSSLPRLDALHLNIKTWYSHNGIKKSKKKKVSKDIPVIGHRGL
jgi:hypothetical protein